MTDCTYNPDRIVHLIAPNQQACSPNPEIGLSDLSDRDRVWDTHRAEASAVEQLYQEAGLKAYEARVQNCSRWLGFGLHPEPDELRLKLTEARFCRVRHCPVCQWRRSMAWRARFLAAAPQIAEAFPTHRWIFLTLTVRNCPAGELRTTLQQMAAAWQRLVKRGTFPAVGFIRSVEVTRGQDSTAHPHYHCLLLVKSSYFSTGYLKHSDWRILWKECLRVDYDPIVNVKSVKSGKAGEENNPIRGALETLKYGVKVQDLVSDAEWLAAITDQLHKTRAIAVGGVLRDFLREDEPEDLIHVDEQDSEQQSEQVTDLWFTWKEIRKRYIKADR